MHSHTLKVKARVRAKGQRGSKCYGEKKVAFLRRKCKPQSQWLLHLAGDFHSKFDDGHQLADDSKRRMMRAMLTTNIAIDQRFVFLARPWGVRCVILRVPGLHAAVSALPIRQMEPRADS